MYLYKNSLDLATNASSVPNNICLLFSKDDDVLADALAVLHESYVNIIPIMNTEKRAKYIPIFSGKDRGKGTIKQVKWVDINDQIFFVIASTHGLQIYDHEISSMVFHHTVRETGDEKSYANGICAIRNILCVGTHYGTIWLFRQCELNNNDFKVLTRLFAHDGAVSIIESLGNHMISSSEATIYLWNCCDEKDFNIIRKFEVPGMEDVAPTVIHFKFGIIVVAYKSGEFCIFDLNDHCFYLRTLAHKLPITGIDFSPNFMVVTVSSDCMLKIWKYEQLNSNVILLQSVMNEEGPLYGVGFLNYSSTEFCTVTGGDTKIKIYIDWENEIGPETFKE